MAKRNNFTAGLAGLLQGVNQGAQQSYTNKVAGQEIGWKDPSRPIDPNELKRMILENYQKGLVNQMGYAGFANGAPTPQNFMQQVTALNALQNAPAGFDPTTGQPNPVVPVQQVQGLPGPSMPQGQAQTAAPTAVNRAGTLQSVADEMKRRGLIQ